MERLPSKPSISQSTSSQLSVTQGARPKTGSTQPVYPQAGTSSLALKRSIDNATSSGVDPVQLEKIFFAKKKDNRHEGNDLTCRKVYEAYVKNDATSLRSAWFLRNCFNQGISLEPNKPIMPQDIVEEYLRTRGNPGKHFLAIACFLQECVKSEVSGEKAQQQVDASDVIKYYELAGEHVGKYRFLEHCCLNGIKIKNAMGVGEFVSPDEVVKAFPESEKKRISRGYFLEQCHLRDWKLTDKHGNKQAVSPDTVLAQFADERSTEGRARFLSECVLKCIAVKNSRGIALVPEVSKVLAMFPLQSLAKVRFLADLCLQGIAIDSEKVPKCVTPAEVIRAYQELGEVGQLGLARFKQECFIRGLIVMHSRRKSVKLNPVEVLQTFPDNEQGQLGRARFQAFCCLSMVLIQNGNKSFYVQPSEVVAAYEAINATLEKARFLAQCSLRYVIDHTKSEEVVIAVEDALKAYPYGRRGQLGAARLHRDCFLRNIPILNEKGEYTHVNPLSVLRIFEDLGDRQASVIFQAECCLRGIDIQVGSNSQIQLTPESISQLFVDGGWHLRRMLFLSRLTLQLVPFLGKLLTNDAILAGFDALPSNYVEHQLSFLLEKLIAMAEMDDCSISQMQSLCDKAMNIISKQQRLDENSRFQRCVLLHVAMKHDLDIKEGTQKSKPTAQNVLTAIKALRKCHNAVRLTFFFLADCHFCNINISGEAVQESQVMSSLEEFNEQKGIKRALQYWFQSNQQSNQQSNSLDKILDIDKSSEQRRMREIQRKNLKTSVQTCSDDTKTGFIGAVVIPPAISPISLPQINITPSLAMVLEAISEINAFYTATVIVITGSFSRCLQGMTQIFNDIDVMSTREASQLLSQKLYGKNSYSEASNGSVDTQIPKKVMTHSVDGCEEIKLPAFVNISIKEGDLWTNSLTVQANIYQFLPVYPREILHLTVVGTGISVPCLSFESEIQMLINVVKYFKNDLSSLTSMINGNSSKLYIPRSLIFSYQTSTEATLNALFMRCMLTLNKADEFLGLLDNVDSNTNHEILKTKKEILVLTSNALMNDIKRHPHKSAFMSALDTWLLHSKPTNTYEDKRRTLVQKIHDKLVKT